jgi:hypothetical protein
MIKKEIGNYDVYLGVSPAEPGPGYTLQVRPCPQYNYTSGFPLLSLTQKKNCHISTGSVLAPAQSHRKKCSIKEIILNFES